MTDYILAFGGGDTFVWASWTAFIGVGLLALHAGWLVGIAATQYFGQVLYLLRAGCTRCLCGVGSRVLSCLGPPRTGIR